MSEVSIKVGDAIPEGTFSYVPYTKELEVGLACGVPTTLNTESWKGKKVVLISVPGAFTPTCHVNHLPGFLQKYEELKAKGVDEIAVVAANDAFVMSGWGQVQGLKDKILCLSDPGAKWSEKMGLSIDLSARGMGVRTTRYAMIIDDLTVKYIGVEPVPSAVSISGVDNILAAL